MGVAEGAPLLSVAALMSHAPVGMAMAPGRAREHAGRPGGHHGRRGHGPVDARLVRRPCSRPAASTRRPSRSSTPASTSSRRCSPAGTTPWPSPSSVSSCRRTRRGRSSTTSTSATGARPTTRSSTSSPQKGFADKDPDTVRAFVAATTEGLSWAVAHPDEAVALYVKRHPELDAGLLLAQWKAATPSMAAASGGHPAGWQDVAALDEAERLDGPDRPHQDAGGRVRRRHRRLPAGAVSPAAEVSVAGLAAGYGEPGRRGARGAAPSRAAGARPRRRGVRPARRRLPGGGRRAAAAARARSCTCSPACSRRARGPCRPADGSSPAATGRAGARRAAAPATRRTCSSATCCCRGRARCRTPCSRRAWRPGARAPGAARREAREPPRAVYGATSSAAAAGSWRSSGWATRSMPPRRSFRAGCASASRSRARVLMDRGLILLDEPFGSLDAVTRAEMRRWLLDVMAAHPATWVLVTHDVEEAVLLGDHVAVLHGRPARLEGWRRADLDRAARTRLAAAAEGDGLEDAADAAGPGGGDGRRPPAAAPGRAPASADLRRRARIRVPRSSHALLGAWRDTNVSQSCHITGGRPCDS